MDVVGRTWSIYCSQGRLVSHKLQEPNRLVGCIGHEKYQAYYRYVTPLHLLCIAPDYSSYYNKILCLMYAIFAPIESFVYIEKIENASRDSNF